MAVAVPAAVSSAVGCGSASLPLGLARGARAVRVAKLRVPVRVPSPAMLVDMKTAAAAAAAVWRG